MNKDASANSASTVAWWPGRSVELVAVTTSSPHALSTILRALYPGVVVLFVIQSSMETLDEHLAALEHYNRGKIDVDDVHAKVKR